MGAGANARKRTKSKCQILLKWCHSAAIKQLLRHDQDRTSERTSEATQTDKTTAGVFLETLSALAYKEREPTAEEQKRSAARLGVASGEGEGGGCVGFTPRAISHNRQNRKFSACRALKKAAENQFYQEIATANTENGNCPADGVGLLGRIAACSPIMETWKPLRVVLPEHSTGLRSRLLAVF